MAVSGGETSQTLDRGLTVLSLLARSTNGLTAAELAEELRTARAAVYRLLRTLEAHNLVGRIDTRYVLWFGVAELAGQLKPRLQATVLPILLRLSEVTNSTALLSVADGNQALILLTAEPPRSTMHLAMREGARHALTLGADGIAILAGRPESEEDPEDVRLARSRGYALSIGSLQEGAMGIAAPIRVSDWATASLGVVQLGVRLEDDQVPLVVTEAAREAATRLGGKSGPEAVAQNQTPTQ
ncbi:helix-turn-helix domain-containing protein [Streptomyces sp. NA02950]|uniref:IclR family transcriptional regulator n=1 Tax=Streptomyces sp. NA02950 TaxID=2742137 RepID=UPI00159204C5|nr:helix-turn-helix domain-containing protein [Streptomyces sp. NA02950]QKV93091.1 helix-turn-helix domain-containing protein [Streptomyces sp. NA02950]